MQTTANYREFSASLHEKGFFQSQPLNGMLELTYACNLKCVHCYTDCYNKPGLIKQERSYEELARILDDMAETGVLWLCLTGGEIFMRKDFKDIYLYARKKGFLITLFTNATLISEEMADFLKENPPFSIETSLHAATSETFEKITQVKGSFERFLASVQRLLERGLPLKVKTKAMTLNIHELERIKRVVESFGLAFKVSTQLYPRLDGDLEPTKFRLSPMTTVEVEYRYRMSRDEEGSCLEEEQEALPPKNLYRCGCGTTGFKIDPYGTLRSCTFVTEPTRPLREENFLEQFLSLSSEIRSKVYRTDSPCRTCGVFRFCDKIPASGARETGDPEKPLAHFCQVAYGRERLSRKMKEEERQKNETFRETVQERP